MIVTPVLAVVFEWGVALRARRAALLSMIGKFFIASEPNG
jgi:hypothetical protein